MGYKLKTYFELITFQHTLFALPFAYVGMMLGFHGIPQWKTWLWVSIVMVGARTFGMGMNRLIDHDIDAKNVRTYNRPLPAGRISRQEVWGLVLTSTLLIVVGCFNLNRTALSLSPLILAMMWGYSYLKRFTWLSHFALGLILGCAPILGWLASTNTITLSSMTLGIAVLFWVAGFDIIYATQDVEFDIAQGLWSIPSLMGVPSALLISKFCHIVSFLILLLIGWNLHLRFWYWGGLLVIGWLMYYQHRIVSPQDIKQVNRAFFVANGCVSIILFCAILLDVKK